MPTAQLIADIVLSTGNFTLPTPTEGAGLYPFSYDALALDCDSRSLFRIFHLSFDTQQQSLDFVCRRILRVRAKYRLCGFHSHGSRVCRAVANILSKGYPNDDPPLEGDASIDLAWAIDPVPFSDEASIAEMMMPTDKPWHLPPNVLNAIGFQTLNWRLGMPFGRKLAPAVGVTTPIRQVYFDRNTEPYDGDLFERWIKDGSVDHANIDNHPDVWGEMRKSLKNLITFGEQERA